MSQKMIGVRATTYDRVQALRCALTERDQVAK